MEQGVRLSGKGKMYVGGYATLSYLQCCAVEALIARKEWGPTEARVWCAFQLARFPGKKATPSRTWELLGGTHYMPLSKLSHILRSVRLAVIEQYRVERNKRDTKTNRTHFPRLVLRYFSTRPKTSPLKLLICLLAARRMRLSSGLIVTLNQNLISSLRGITRQRIGEAIKGLEADGILEQYYTPLKTMLSEGKLWGFTCSSFRDQHPRYTPSLYQIEQDSEIFRTE